MGLSEDFEHMLVMRKPKKLNISATESYPLVYKRKEMGNVLKRQPLPRMKKKQQQQKTSQESSMNDEIKR